MANWAWKPNRHFGSFSSSMACGKAALSMKKRIQPFRAIRAIPDRSAPAWHPVGSLQAPRAPTPPPALDGTRPTASNTPKPFTGTAEPDKIIVAVSHGYQVMGGKQRDPPLGSLLCGRDR